METIHKKNGRLHIYVRQDKYKGEIKSHNWVGRTYINGKQKIISSGTTNLEEAIPILEKWYDNLQVSAEQKEKDFPSPKNELLEKEEPKNKITDPPPKENISQPPTSVSTAKPSLEQNINKGLETPKASSNIFDKLKKFKISTPSFKKKEASSNPSKAKKFYGTLQNLFKSKVSKMNIASEEIVGIDVTFEAVQVAQVSKDKDEQWILDKYSYRWLDPEKVNDNVIENKEYVSEQISLALSNAKITTKNAAISIPVTSAFIRVLDSPLMTDEELNNAIETDSLWENLVEMKDINDYSIFHQVINRNSKTNTMEILFVASKLSDVNQYISMAKKSGVNPVIMDVRCFTLKNAFDNISFHKANQKQSAIMEIGIHENYLMVIYNNKPIVIDIFLRPQEKQLLINSLENLENAREELENVIRRYSMQIKQAIQDHENKYETKIHKIQVVSHLKNVEKFLPYFRKNLPNTGFEIFDPLKTVSVPTYNKEKTNTENKSTMSAVLGLAYRKLDVFGYYKFVTAVKNINLLPNRSEIRSQNKIKFLSGFAFKGVGTAIAIIYFVLISFSFTQYYFNKEKLLAYDEIKANYEKISIGYKKNENKLNEMQASLQIGANIASNQAQSYRALAQVARSVPGRVKFSKIEYDGENQILVEGLAFENGDVNNFNKNLNKKSLIKLATVDGTTAATADQIQETSMKRSFKIKIVLDFSEKSKGN